MVEGKCKKCGCEIEEGLEICSKCDEKEKSELETNKSTKLNSFSKYGTKIKNSFHENKKVWIIVGAVLAIILVTIIIINHNNKVKRNRELAELERYNSLPIVIDVSMTSYYGNIDDILDELGLDFHLVTMGANCYAGVQKSEFKTEKFGVLHTEFRYCKSNETQVFRVYNDNTDQELREPKAGEFPNFDKYGDVIKDNTKSL